MEAITVITPYPETHQTGRLDIHNEYILREELCGSPEIDFGVQIAEDGRVWVCINGIAFLRFKPSRPGKKT